jgi:hypothetical protein
MCLDIFCILFVIVAIARFIRAFCMRVKLMRQIKELCKQRDFHLKTHRNPFLSFLYKGKRFDFTIETPQKTYVVKLITCFSKIKIYHFIDEESYVTYFKTFIVLPMATKVTEGVHWSCYHRFPRLEKAEGDNVTHVLLFNPAPNDITYIDKKGLTQIAGNDTVIGDLQLFNGKGFLNAIERDCL